MSARRLPAFEIPMVLEETKGTGIHGIGGPGGRKLPNSMMCPTFLALWS